MLTRLYEEKRAQLQAKRERSEAESRVQEAGPMMREAMQQWLDGTVAPDSKPTTLSEYRRTCNYYIEFCGDHPLRKFRKHHATKFQTALQQRGLSDAGIRKHQTHLQTFLSWCWCEELLDRPVKVSKVRVTRHSPKIYSPEEVNALRTAIQDAVENAANSYLRKCARNHLRVFMVARNTVLRNSEVLNLPLRHIHLNEGVLQIAAVPESNWNPKNRQERIVPMNPELVKFLESDLEQRGKQERWFLDDGQGGQVYSSNCQLSQAFRRHVSRCGLEQDGRKPLHALRATGITEMLGAGGQLHFVQRIAGHSNPQTTLNHYARVENFDLRETVGLLSAS